jgi:DNA-binding transcriptional ArsR family regulator
VAGDLQADLRIPGSTLSHHLEALLSQGLIEQQREGRFLRYRASTNTLRELLDFLYAECCAPAGLVPAIGRGAGTAAVPLYD